MNHAEIKHLKVDHTPAELDAPAKLLLKAAALIEKHGLAKFTQLAEDGSMCTAGAIVVAEERNPHECDGYGPVGKIAIARLLPHIGQEYGPADWNNAPERTKDQVVAKLRAVAFAAS